MRSIVFIICFIFSLASYARGFCSKRQLQNKDCSLQTGDYKLRFWNDKIFLVHPVERDTAMLTLSGESVEWSFVQLKPIGGRLFFEVGLWSAPEDKVGVSSLHWTVYEIVKQDIQERLSRVIQKRKLVDNGKWRLDPQLRHELKLVQKNIVWHVDRDSGILPHPSPTKEKP